MANLDLGQRLAGRYLILSLQGEEFAISVTQVREIVGLMPIRSVPQSPVHVKGVINLRGTVFSVVDLRNLMGMPCGENDHKTCIVVVEVQSLDAPKCWEVKDCGKEECPGYENSDRRCWMITATHCRGEVQGTYLQKMDACRKCQVYQEVNAKQMVTTMGLVVDRVNEVVDLKAEQFEPMPADSSGSDGALFQGVVKIEAGVKFILDINQALGSSTQMSFAA